MREYFALDIANSSHTAIQVGKTAADEVHVTDYQPYDRLPAKHGHHVMTLHVRSYEHINLDFFIEFIQRAARNLQIPTSGTARLPTTKELHTVIKSHFVHKKTQENFARLTHRRAIKVFDASPEVLDLWLRYIHKHAIAGVGMKAYVHEMVEFGFASGEMTKLQEALGDSDKVKQVAEEYIKTLSGQEFEPVKIEAMKSAETEEVNTGEATGAEAVDAAKEATTDVNAAEAVAAAPKTPSEEAVKADDSSKGTPHLQQETAKKAEAEAIKEAEAQAAGAEAVVDTPKTSSEESVKADSSSKKPEQLQKETASKAKKDAVKEAEAEVEGAEAVADAPKTASEEAAKAEHSDKSPERLQKETAKAAKSQAEPKA